MSKAAARPFHHSFLGTPYQGFEVLVAGCVALSVPVWSALLLSMSKLGEQAVAVEIAPTDEIPMSVKPVVDMDSPLLKLGGGKGKKIKLPDAWAKPAPKDVKAPDQPDAKPTGAQVSTKAGEDVKDIPDAGTEMSDADEAIDPDAAVAEPDADVEKGAGGASGSEVPEGGGSPEGSPIGTSTKGDLLKTRAANQYHARIQAFLYQGWRCPPAGAACQGTGSVTLSGTTITGASYSGCGNSAVDAAAEAHVKGKVGQSIPPPPELYPDLAPSSFTIGYVCRGAE
ncbi:MAG: hypothetical protein R3B72_33395 [Polyangiaceae bacterium]